MAHYNIVLLTYLLTYLRHVVVLASAGSETCSSTNDSLQSLQLALWQTRQSNVALAVVAFRHGKGCDEKKTKNPRRNLPEAFLCGA